MARRWQDEKEVEGEQRERFYFHHHRRSPKVSTNRHQQFCPSGSPASQRPSSICLTCSGAFNCTCSVSALYLVSLPSPACLPVLVSFSDEGEWQARQFFALVYAPLLQTRILQRNTLTNQDHSNGRPINQSNFRWILARPTLLAATFIRQIHLDVRSGPNMCMHTDCRC